MIPPTISEFAHQWASGIIHFLEVHGFNGEDFPFVGEDHVYIRTLLSEFYVDDYIKDTIRKVNCWCPECRQVFDANEVECEHHVLFGNDISDEIVDDLYATIISSQISLSEFYHNCVDLEAVERGYWEYTDDYSMGCGYTIGQYRELEHDLWSPDPEWVIQGLSWVTHLEHFGGPMGTRYVGMTKEEHDLMQQEGLAAIYPQEQIDAFLRGEEEEYLKEKEKALA